MDCGSGELKSFAWSGPEERLLFTGAAFWLIAARASASLGSRLRIRCQVERAAASAPRSL